MSDFTVQELTLGQLLENTAARFPDTDAVIHADRELRQTWSEFSACVDDMARGLMAIGVQKGEKVAVWATNVPHWVTLMFATARIGAILVTVNTNYRETELRYLLQQSECENLFIIDSVRDHDFIASTYEVLPRTAPPAARDARSRGSAAPEARVFPWYGQAPGHVFPAGTLFPRRRCLG